MFCKRVNGKSQVSIITALFVFIASPAIASVSFDGLTWYYSGNTSDLFINGDGDLEWDPDGEEEFITRIPDQSLSQVGDVVEISYMWLTDGRHDCPDCFDCDLFCHDNDITCIAGTSDMRVGLFEADGEYVTSDGFDVTGSSIFYGYKGYNFRFGPNMEATDPNGLTRWRDCHGEIHKTGMFAKKPVNNSDLMFYNDGLKDRIPGFELPPGDWSQLTVSLERTSASNVLMTITLNDRTYTYDDYEPDQPSKIDVLAVHMRNHRPYSRLVLGKVCHLGPADMNADGVIDGNDLSVLTDDWLQSDTTEMRGTAPNAGNLILYYNFDGPQGQEISTVPELSGSGVGPLVKFTNSVKYGAPNPLIGTGTSADFQGGAFYADHHSVLNLNLGEFTIAGFIYPRSIAQSVIIRKRDGGSGEWYLDLRSGGQIGFTAHDDDHILLSSPLVQANNWYHVAGVFDEDATPPMKVYINGQLAGTGNNTLRPAATTEPLGVGCIIRGSTSNTGQYYNGLIDELKIYNYALSEDEIIYEANNGQALILIPLDSPANLFYDGIINLKDFAAFASGWRGDCE